MSRVTLEGVVKTFGTVQAVREVSFAIEDRSFVTLLGPSGCGKTTTLNLIAGLEKITRGEIFLDDQRITDWAPHERGMAMVFQNYALYPHMNVYGNIAFSLKLSRRPKREIDERVRRVAAALELDHLLERRVAQLSGGQQQRVALARAMVKEPKVFLFDEPLSNLDAALRTRMRSEIKRLHQQLRATSIFVTHDQEEAMMLSDYIAVMRDGQIVQYGPADEIYRRPQHIYVATFIGKPRMSTVEGRLHVTTERISYESGGLRLSWPNASNGQTVAPLEAQAVLGIRAEDVQITAADDTSDTDQIVGEVGLLEPLGSDTFVEVNRGPVTITGRVEPDRRLRLGDRVALDLPRHKLHFFDATSGERLDV
jgi:ABC-type sugar transport system ATPase subunit